MFAHPFRTFVLSYHINSRKYTFNINGLVGGDAHIAPLSTTEFAEDFHKTGACRRVDVGIDPYERLRKIFKRIVGADDPVRPWKVANSP